LAQSAAYNNVRGKKNVGTNSTYMCYSHRKDPLGKTLGRYSLLSNTPDEVKKIVHDGIGDIFLFLEASSRSVLYSLQSSNTFLDVKDKNKIPDIYDNKHLDKKMSRRGFATQLCVVIPKVRQTRILHLPLGDESSPLGDRAASL
jgi:hypothetical protein